MAADVGFGMDSLSLGVPLRLGALRSGSRFMIGDTVAGMGMELVLVVVVVMLDGEGFGEGKDEMVSFGLEVVGCDGVSNGLPRGLSASEGSD